MDEKVNTKPITKNTVSFSAPNITENIAPNTASKLNTSADWFGFAKRCPIIWAN